MCSLPVIRHHKMLSNSGAQNLSCTCITVAPKAQSVIVIHTEWGITNRLLQKKSWMYNMIAGHRIKVSTQHV